MDDGHDEEEDEDDIRLVDFTPHIPQPPSSQLSLSELDKTVINSKNLIIEYENAIDRYQRGPTYNKMSKEALAAEEKRKIRLIELETRKLSVYTEMQQDERNARLESLKQEKLQREADKEKKNTKNIIRDASKNRNNKKERSQSAKTSLPKSNRPTCQPKLQYWKS